MARSNGKKNVEVLESGSIYFMYRPRVGEDSGEVQGMEDVQRFYLVLSPNEKQSYRLIAIPKKKLPDVEDGHERFWAYIRMVSKSPDGVQDELGGESRPGAERTIPAARPSGEGVYSIVRHGDHTHLVYALELPDQPQEVQEALNIEEEGSYILSVKNPEKPSPRGVGLQEERQAEYPRELQEHFRGRRFVSVEPPGFLDYEGTELLFIGAAEDVSEELGLELETEDESEATAEIFNDLRLKKSEHPVEPLLKGKWA